MLEKRVDERTKALQLAMLELAQANDKLARLTVTDALTGLANRRQFDEVLQKEIQRTARNKQSLSLVLMDIDHFKQLNDVHGHLAGDECLRNRAAVRYLCSARFEFRPCGHCRFNRDGHRIYLGNHFRCSADRLIHA